MKTILGAIALFLIFGPAWAEQQGVADIQSMLAECGFNPGPVDGLWGSKTASAAADYVRAHGGQPDSGKRVNLMAQVDGYRIGDQGPCPTAEQASGPVESTGGAADQAQMQDNKASSGKSASEEIDNFRKIAGGLIYKHGGYPNQHLELQVLEDKVIEQRYKNGVKHEAANTIIFSEIERAYIVGDRIGYNLAVDLLETATHYSRGVSGVYFDDYDHTKSAAIALNKVAQIYGENRTNTSPPVNCIEWADLGSVSTGAWRNGNGRVTRGFKAGDLGRAHDRTELVENYETSHQHCLDMNENTMKQAIVDMVIIGRKATCCFAFSLVAPPWDLT